MGFQILDKDGNAITINDLDKEAAALWDKPFHVKSYANPTPLTGDEIKDVFNAGSNWFDTVGYNIHHCQPNYYKRYDGTITWKMVKESLALSVTDILSLLDKVKFGPDTEEDDQKVLVAIGGLSSYLAPYFKLIDMWEAKGYTPKRVED